MIMLRRVLFSLLATLIAATAPANAQTNTRIVFTSNRDGDFEIYVAESGAEADAEQLTDDPFASNYNPYWSPDGRAIHYINDPDGEGERRLMVMDADGSNKRSLTEGTDVVDMLSFPEWSPDSRYLLFGGFTEPAASGADSIRMYIYDLQTDKRVQLNYEMPAGIPSVAWTPDNEPLVMTADGLAITDLRGEEYTLLVPQTRSIFDITPDGEYVVVELPSAPNSSLCGDGTSLTAFSMAALRDGSVSGNAFACTPTGILYRAYFSPDGSKLALDMVDVSDREGAETVYVLDAVEDRSGNLKGENLRAVIKDSFVVWLPNSNAMGFDERINNEPGQLFITDLSGKVEQITFATDTDDPESNVQGDWFSE
jgi:WD40 repeat protein